MAERTRSVRIKIDREACKGCGLCVAFCAKGCLEMEKALNASGVQPAAMKHEDRCGGCRNCAVVCPECGIQVLYEE
jgi:2-oxoglutarate ferredoxin oxidoreductase subunit delta